MATVENAGNTNPLVKNNQHVQSAVSLICRYCPQPIPAGEEVKTFGYWDKGEHFCHAQCKPEGEKQEALDCQVVDADCNDCKHYQRGKLAPKTVSKLWTPNGIQDVVFNPQIYIGGTCLKFQKPTLAQPNKWSGYQCFEHRRVSLESAHPPKSPPP